MQLDPTRWLVSMAGFTYDWIITREWARILFSLVPLAFLLAIGGLVWSGTKLDKRLLAARYMELGEKEISGWEDALVSLGSRPAPDAEDSPDGPPKDTDAPIELSAFADLLFRRVQLLSPSERSQYVIGANLALRGAVAQGKDMLLKIAPHDEVGYAPAHARLAIILLQEFQVRPTRELARLLMHHIREAKKAERVPTAILQAGSDLFWASGDQAESIRLLAQASETDPSLNLLLSKRARVAKNQRVIEQAVKGSKEHFQSQLTEDPLNVRARINLVDTLIGEQNFDEAERLLREASKFPTIQQDPYVTRALSEIYRFRFLKSMRREGGKDVADVQLLDSAMRIDPTNPMVVQEVAKLARMRGPEATEQMVKKLQQFLAEGKATVATHAWLSEEHLIKENYEKALPHLEQVVTRLPNASQYLNNLAYVLAELHPERLQEALEYSQRSVASAAKAKNPNADFYDTLGLIYSKLKQSKEAIAAYETAIELQPRRKDFHDRVAKEYDKVGNDVMAANHRQVIQTIVQDEAAQQEQVPGSPPDQVTPKESHESEKSESQEGSSSQDPANGSESTRGTSADGNGTPGKN